MTTISFTFDSDLEGWVDNSPVGATIAHNASDGHDSPGCLQLSLGATTTLSAQVTLGSTTTIAAGDGFSIWYRVLAETGQTLFRDLILTGGGSPAGTVHSDSIVIPGGNDTGWDEIAVDLSGEIGNTFNIIRTSFQVGGVVPFVFRLDDVLYGPPQARFYQGDASLAEKFTLPFAGVAPGGMTLDRSLGTVVMGSNAPNSVMVVSAVDPYATGTANGVGLPVTGTAVTSVKWI